LTVWSSEHFHLSHYFPPQAAETGIQFFVQTLLASFGKDLSGEDLSINSLMDATKKPDSPNAPKEMGDL
jgi:hypothetical protein